MFTVKEADSVSVKLRAQIEFLVEAFTQRDSDQRYKIQMLEAELTQTKLMMNVQNTKLAYYQGLGHSAEDGPKAAS